MGIIIAVLCIFAVFYCIADRDQSGTSHRKYIAGSILELGDKTASEKLDEIELHAVSMQLRLDEACYFEGEGFSYHTKYYTCIVKETCYNHEKREGII